MMLKKLSGPPTKLFRMLNTAPDGAVKESYLELADAVTGKPMWVPSHWVCPSLGDMADGPMACPVKISTGQTVEGRDILDYWENKISGNKYKDGSVELRDYDNAVVFTVKDMTVDTINRSLTIDEELLHEMSCGGVGLNVTEKETIASRIQSLKDRLNAILISRSGEESDSTNSGPGASTENDAAIAAAMQRMEYQGRGWQQQHPQQQVAAVAPQQAQVMAQPQQERASSCPRWLINLFCGCRARSARVHVAP